MTAPLPAELIAICVCTYNRPKGLAALLASLDRQRLSQLRDEQIVVVVVDNSAEASAVEVCHHYDARGRFDLRAVHEPKKGLVHARNASVATARAENASHVIFIDDDEAADPLWLEALAARLTESGAAAALGPVFPVFERAPPPWLPVHRYVNRVPASAGFAADGFTCNAIVAVTALGEGAVFDARFNETGGEDTMFFKQLLARGHRIAWAEEARMHEFVPEARMRRRWLFRRWYRTGNVEAHLALASNPSAGSRLASLGKGLARLGGGGLRIAYALVAHGWRRPDRVTSSCYTACRGAGYVAAAFGTSYREYSQPGYR